MSQPLSRDDVGPGYDFGSSWRLREGDEIVPNCYAWNLLGQGRRFETWVAWDTVRWSPACVKLPRQDRLNERTRAALTREHDAVSRLRHPSVQRLLEGHLTEEPPYLVYEYVEGFPLSDGLREEGPMAPIDVAWLGLELASALHYIHGRGIVHLDLKPSNIVLRDGRSVIMDFDVALPIGGQRSRTKPRGTHAYMAPEQVRCDLAQPAMDLFALGVVLYEMATGISPFEVPTAELDTEQARRRPFLQLHLQPDPLDVVLTDFPTGLANTISRLIAPDPRSRIPSALHVIRALGEALPDDVPGLGPPWIDALGRA